MSIIKMLGGLNDHPHSNVAPPLPVSQRGSYVVRVI